MALVPLGIGALLGWLFASGKKNTEPAPVTVKVATAPDPTSEAALKAKMLAAGDRAGSATDLRSESKEIIINGQPLTSIITPPSAVVASAGNPPLGVCAVTPAIVSTAPEVTPLK